MLSTKRLQLREWRDGDKPQLAQILSDPEVMQFLGGIRTPAETNDTIDLLNRWLLAGEPSFWATERLCDERLIGWIGLHRLGANFPFGPALEIGWRLGRKYWGHGYATEGARAALNYAFEMLDAPRVFAFTASANARSEGVMRRIGLTKVDGGEFAHPDFARSDPHSIHVLYVAEREAHYRALP